METPKSLVIRFEISPETSICVAGGVSAVLLKLTLSRQMTEAFPWDTAPRYRYCSAGRGPFQYGIRRRALHSRLVGLEDDRYRYEG
jgi:hypothetical protein